MSQHFLERSCETECEKIIWFFDYTMTNLISVPAVEQLAGVPEETLKSLLIDRQIIREPKQVRDIVHVLERIGYRAQWDWDYIIKTDLPS